MEPDDNEDDIRDCLLVTAGHFIVIGSCSPKTLTDLDWCASRPPEEAHHATAPVADFLSKSTATKFSAPSDA